MAPVAALFFPMTDLRDQQLAWIENIIVSTGLTLTDVARRAGLDPSTLTRFRARNDGGHTLTSRTVQKIETATGVAAYEARPRASLTAFNEPDAEPFKFEAAVQSLMVQALKSVVAQSNSVDLWVMKTPVLTAAGYRQGDVLIVDRDLAPKAGDAVCAQKYDFRRGTAETIFRVYRTPYLLTAQSDGEPGLPEIVDDENVVIRGVVVGGARLRG